MLKKPQCLSRYVLPQKRTFVSLFVLPVILLILGGHAAFAQVTTQLCFAIDGSGSLDPAEFTLETGGIAAAIEDGTIVPPNGSVEISVVQFPGTLEVGPVVIDSAATATATADAIRSINFAVGGFTPMDQGIDDCVDAITTSSEFASAQSQVINVTTDGEPTDQSGFPTPAAMAAALAARDNAVAMGIDQLHAEAVGPGAAGAGTTFLLDLVFPQPSELVPSGGMPTAPQNTGFVVVVTNFADYAVAIENKITAIIEPPAEAGDHLACYKVKEKDHKRDSKKVILHNQFEEGTKVYVGELKLLCVPTVKELDKDNGDKDDKK